MRWYENDRWGDVYCLDANCSIFTGTSRILGQIGLLDTGPNLSCILTITSCKYSRRLFTDPRWDKMAVTDHLTISSLAIQSQAFSRAYSSQFKRKRGKKFCWGVVWHSRLARVNMEKKRLQLQQTVRSKEGVSLVSKNLRKANCVMKMT